MIQILLAMAVAAAGASSTSLPARVIPDPEWASLPTGRDMKRAFPERAQKENQSGVAAVECAVTAAGALADCVTIEEAPAGYGFGAAAAKLGQIFSIKPTARDGSSVAGAHVFVPIQFNIVNGRPPAPPSPVKQYYPLAAHVAEVEGSATLNCEIRPRGDTRNCRVVSETPSDWGFGASAIKLSARLNIKQASAQAPARMNIPISFKFDGTPSAAPLYNCYALFFAAEKQNPSDAATVLLSRRGEGLLRVAAILEGAQAAETDALLKHAREETSKPPERLEPLCRDRLRAP